MIENVCYYFPMIEAIRNEKGRCMACQSYLTKGGACTGQRDVTARLTKQQWNVMREIVDRCPDGWRFGQAFFNVIERYYPEIAERIRGTEADPYYGENANTWKRFKQAVLTDIAFVELERQGNPRF